MFSIKTPTVSDMKHDVSTTDKPHKTKKCKRGGRKKKCIIMCKLSAYKWVIVYIIIYIYIYIYKQ